jgi:hypothetical protein
MNDRTTGPIVIAAEQAAGRLATGDPTRRTFDEVRVRCGQCGGVTVFPVAFNRPRPAPAPCAHCGKDI